MCKIRKTCLVVLVSLFAMGTFPFQAQADEEPPAITVQTGKKHIWTYTHEQLLAMAKVDFLNQKGTRMKPAIPLETLLFKDTGMSLDMVREVFISVRQGMITVFRGDDLAYLDNFVLMSGPDKNGQPHFWSMAPEDDATYRAFSSVMGSNRRHDVYRIDITEKVGTVQ